MTQPLLQSYYIYMLDTFMLMWYSHIVYVGEVFIIIFLCYSYADRAKQIVCKAIVNEDPNAKVIL